MMNIEVQDEVLRQVVSDPVEAIVLGLQSFGMVPFEVRFGRASYECVAEVDYEYAGDIKITVSPRWQRPLHEGALNALHEEVVRKYHSS